MNTETDVTGGRSKRRPYNEEMTHDNRFIIADSMEDYNPGSPQYDALIYHAIRCDVDGPRVTMTVLRPCGSVVDRFTLGPK